jgi:trehalose synthase
MVPAIDPLSPKNLPVPDDLVHGLVRWFGVELDRPLLTQVSRFDPWKDPLGVIRVYRQLREWHPGLQLALLGQMALDDPEGWTIYDTIREDRRRPRHPRPTNFNGVAHQVNAFSGTPTWSSRSPCVRVRARRLETLWKGTPVVAGHRRDPSSSRTAAAASVEREDGGSRASVNRWTTKSAGRSAAASGWRPSDTRLLEDELRLMADVLERSPE